MYGTIWRCRPNPGQEQVFVDLARRWLRERASAVDGFIAEYILTSETKPGELLGLVLFDRETNYRSFAADPSQHDWFEQFRATVEADFEWNDGEIVALEPATVPL